MLNWSRLCLLTDTSYEDETRSLPKSVWRVSCGLSVLVDWRLSFISSSSRLVVTVWCVAFSSAAALLQCGCQWSCGSSFAPQLSELEVLLIYCHEELWTQFRKQTNRKKTLLSKTEKSTLNSAAIRPGLWLPNSWKYWNSCVPLVSYSVVGHSYLSDDGKRVGPGDGGQSNGCPDQSTRADWRQQASMA